MTHDTRYITIRNTKLLSSPESVADRCDGRMDSAQRLILLPTHHADAPERREFESRSPQFFFLFFSLSFADLLQSQKPKKYFDFDFVCQKVIYKIGFNVFVFHFSRPHQSLSLLCRLQQNDVRSVKSLLNRCIHGE